MAISNTNILVKRSLTTATPSSLRQGEVAYSYSSNNFFIGDPTGTTVLPIGGYTTYTTVNNATAANTVSTLVKRDTNGAFSGRLYGTANTADALSAQTSFQITGGDITASPVNYQGNTGLTLSASLNTIAGLSAGSYGTSSFIPVITVGANGRILAISTTAASGGSGSTGSLTISDGTTSNSINIALGTFYHKGTNGITATVSPNTVTFSTDTTVARTNTSGLGTQIFNTDVSLPANNLTVGGTLTVANLSVSGNVNYANVSSTLNIGDPIIYLAANNTGNLVDIGFAGHFVGTGHTGGPSIYQHTGFVRDYNDNKWKLFSNVAAEPTSTVVFDANTWYDVIKTGGLDASNGNITFVNSISANSLSLTSALPISSGGANSTAYSTNGMLFYNGVQFLTAANVTPTITGALTAANTIGSITFDAFGRLTAYQTANIAVDTSQITTGTLPIARGGSNSGSYAQNGLLFYNGTQFLTTSNVTPSATGVLSTSNTISSITFNAFGIPTAYTAANIAIDATQVTTGTLPVTRGGTGATSFSLGGLVIGNTTGALISLANSTFSNTGTVATNSTIIGLQVDAYGRVNTAVYTAISGLTVAQGGTGNTALTAGAIVLGQGTSALTVLANSTFSNTGTVAANSTLIGLQVDVYGRTNTAVYSAISGLTVGQGGTGGSSFNSGSLIIGGGTSPMSVLANSSFSNTGTAGANSTLTSLQVDAYGRVNTAVYTAISGLTVSQGGTGLNTANSNGVIFGNGTGVMGVTSVAGSAFDQTWSNQILTVTNAGVPVWSSAMDGGTF